MSFLTRVVVALVLSLAYLSGGVKSLVSMSAQAAPHDGKQAGGSSGKGKSASAGAGGTAGGCGLFLRKK